MGQRLHSCFSQLGFGALLLKFPNVVQIRWTFTINRKVIRRSPQ